MKSEILFLFAIIFYSVAIYSQPVLPPPNNPGSLKEILGLNKTQMQKIEKIIKVSQEKTDKIRERETAIVKRLRDSTKAIFNNSQREIMGVLTKEQAEKFKQMNMFGIFPPPPDMGERNFPQGIAGNFPPTMFNPQMPDRMRCNIPGLDFNQPAPPPCKDNEDLLNELYDLDSFLPPNNPVLPDSTNKENYNH